MDEGSITYDDFTRVDMRVGTITEARVFEKARKPAYQLWIDFGPLGTRKSSAQITKRYSIEELTGMQVVAVVNMPPRQIANFMSECLVLGAVDERGDVILMRPATPAQNGQRIA